MCLKTRTCTYLSLGLQQKFMFEYKLELLQDGIKLTPPDEQTYVTVTPNDKKVPETH